LGWATPPPPPSREEPPQAADARQHKTLTRSPRNRCAGPKDQEPRGTPSLRSGALRAAGPVFARPAVLAAKVEKAGLLVVRDRQ
jgi:hypothetical protein